MPTDTVPTTEITNPAPKAFALCTLTTDSGTLTVPCEPIGAGLVITPGLWMDEDGTSRLSGNFVITHQASGLTVSEGAGCIECCRSAGKALVATGVDWAAMTTENADKAAESWSDELRRKIAEARAVGWSCDAEDCEPWPAGSVDDRADARAQHLARVDGAQ